VATRKKQSVAVESHAASSGAEPLDKIARLLALLAVKGEPQPDKIKALSAAGFRSTEIASLLGLTRNAVDIALHRIRVKG
jgi:DNA-directed RNA polymerase specialized sigma24 family protein